MGNNFTMPQFGNFAQNAWNAGWNAPAPLASNIGGFGGFGFGNSFWPTPFGTTKKKSAEELAKECDAEIARINEQMKVKARDRAAKAQLYPPISFRAPSSESS